MKYYKVSSVTLFKPPVVGQLHRLVATNSHKNSSIMWRSENAEYGGEWMDNLISNGAEGWWWAVVLRAKAKEATFRNGQRCTCRRWTGRLINAASVDVVLQWLFLNVKMSVMFQFAHRCGTRMSTDENGVISRIPAPLFYTSSISKTNLPISFCLLLPGIDSKPFSYI